MNTLKNVFLLSVITCTVFILPACKAKKAAITPSPPKSTETAAPTPPAPEPSPTAEEKPVPPAPAPPNYNFSNIQFEYDSGVLKTEAYPILDKAVIEMKKDTTAKFVLNGHASAEGTTEHNIILSVERANAVKLYLTNSGINANKLATKGYGESMPLSPNTDEASRALNRRVEIKKL